MRRFVFTAFALTLLAACQPGTTELTEEQKAEIAAEVRQTVAAFWNSVEEMDFERWVGVWITDHDHYYQGDPMLFVNRLTIRPTAEDIREVWEPVFEARSGHSIDIGAETVAVLGEDVALHVFKAEYTVSYPEGNTTDPAPVTVSTVWVREGTEWKMLHAHQSFNPAS